MEIFKRTNFDFLGRKWPFILLSLLLTIAGLVSLWMKGGPKYGIDFTGGALMDVNFIKRPPAESIRAALRHKIAGEIEVQEIRNTQEVLISTGARDDNALQVVRGDMISALNSAFNPAEAGQAAGRFDINLTSQAALADHLREPLTRGGVLLSEDQLQAVTKAITSYRDTPPRSGLISNIDDLSSVPGVTAPFLKVLKQESFAGNFAIRSVETVGPRIGADLRQQAINVVLIALAAMLVYIAFRFEWKYGVAAVIAVFHDTIITIGLFSILGKQIDLTVIAALLTLVGYSMNDTIVTFDRIRENLKLHVRGTFPSIVNLSINQTLSRTVLTSGLTFLTALSLFLFGGQVLNGFSLALVIGIIIGTYSSIFIASPILVFWHDVAAGKTGQAKPAAVEVRPAGTGKGVKTAKTVK
jgi:preprotein translocase subunit SecF